MATGISSKSTQISNFVNIRPFGSWVFPCGWLDGQTGGQTDRHDAVNSRLSQFCECA
jgi:hypothetical protein